MKRGKVVRLVGGVTNSTKHSISDLSLTICNCSLILTHKCMRGEIWIIVFALQCDILDSIFIFRNINTFGLYNKGIKMIQGVTYNWFFLTKKQIISTAWLKNGYSSEKLRISNDYFCSGLHYWRRKDKNLEFISYPSNAIYETKISRILKTFSFQTLFRQWYTWFVKPFLNPLLLR